MNKIPNLYCFYGNKKHNKEITQHFVDYGKSINIDVERTMVEHQECQDSNNIYYINLDENDLNLFGDPCKIIRHTPKRSELGQFIVATCRVKKYKDIEKMVAISKFLNGKLFGGIKII